LLVEQHGCIPTRDALRPAIVKVHGGAWIFGSKSALANWDAWLSELGYAVSSGDVHCPAKIKELVRNGDRLGR
jgi:hypothetical protein